MPWQTQNIYTKLTWNKDERACLKRDKRKLWLQTTTNLIIRGRWLHNTHERHKFIAKEMLLCINGASYKSENKQIQLTYPICRWLKSKLKKSTWDERRVWWKVYSEREKWIVKGGTIRQLKISGRERLPEGIKWHNGQL